MITRVQGRTLTGEHIVQPEPRLTSLEKAMLKWIVVDPDDKLLDANVGSGMMAEYLRRNMQCEVCGVSNHMEHVRYARSRLQSCDIVYAEPGDIPWRENAFDTVLMKLGNEEPDILERVFGEAKRVLKPGGQFVLGVVCYPAPVLAVTSLISTDDMGERRFFRRHELQQHLDASGFENISWQRTGLATGVMTAWKAKSVPEV